MDAERPGTEAPAVSRQPAVEAWLRARDTDANRANPELPGSEVACLVMDWRIMRLSRKEYQGTSGQVHKRGRGF